MRPLLLAGSSPGPGSFARGCSTSSASARGRIAALPRQAAPPPAAAAAAASAADAPARPRAAAASAFAASFFLATSPALLPLPVHAAAAAAAEPPQRTLQQQQQQQQRPPLRMCPPLADLAAADAAAPAAAPPPPAVSLNAEPPEESEYRDPFTLYGTTQKQFAIERLDGEKVVSRRRGFTVDACTAALSAADESATLAALPPSEKVRTSSTTACRRGTGADLLPTCAGACQASCAAAVEGQAARGLDRTGLRLGGRDARSVLRRCARDCTSECQKSGKAHDYSVPFRP